MNDSSSKTIGKQEAKTLCLSALGGTLEFYDFVIFVFFMSYFTPHFFPKELSPAWQDFNAYGAYAAAYLARPLGGIIMAHFGDKFGRKNMFMLSILLMVIPTFVIAIMPTYHHIGYLAIIILFFIRILQGVAIGGELPGAWVFVREHSPKNSTGLFLGLLTCGVAGGILLGSGVKLILQAIFTEQQMIDFAWRIPFAIGGIFGICSVYLRRFLSETPVFKKLQEQKQLATFPLKKVVKEYKHSIVLSMMITCVLTACVMILCLLIPNYTIKLVQIDPITNTILQMGGVLMMLIGLVVAGSLSDSFGASGTCKFFAIVLFVFCGLYFYELYVGKNLILLAMFYLVACFSTGVVGFAPIFMCEIFEPSVRFSGISFSYNIAYAIAGAITPMLLLNLNEKAITIKGIWSLGGGIYLCFIAIVAYVCAVYFKKLTSK